MGRLRHRPITLDDLEPYAEFLADPECTLHANGEFVGWAGFQRGALDGSPEVELGPARTIHLIHPGNTASIAVARMLGAIHERDTEIRSGPVSIYVSHIRDKSASKSQQIAPDPARPRVSSQTPAQT